MLSAEANATDCNLCINWKKCRCLKICRLGPLMRPALRKNICGICHETVNGTPPENVRNALMHSPRSAMVLGNKKAASIEFSMKAVKNLEMEINDLNERRVEQLRQIG
jgi:hypothetical protein